MGVMRTFKNEVIKPAVDVKGWVSWETNKKTTLALIRMLKPIFRFKRVDVTVRPEDFQRVAQRMGLSTEDLKEKELFLQYVSILYAAVALLSFFYLVTLVIHAASVWGMLVAFLLGLLFTVKAYAARLYIFQIKHQKLGCTFSEWLHGSIKEQK